MSTATEFQTWVRSQLQEIADGVTPRPDPYGRLVRRRRLGWLRGGLLTGIAALAVSGGVVAVAPAGTPEPTPDPTYRFSGELYWEASLIDAAPRGSVAADEAFTADLAARIEELSRSGVSPMLEDDRGRSTGEVDARVLFAEDIDDTRVVALALLRTSLSSPLQRYGVARLLWIAGPRGAPAEELARADQVPPSRGGYSSTLVRPFALAQAGASGIEAGSLRDPTAVRIALAPPECEVAAAPSEDLDAWQTEPNGSWLVRAAGQYQPEFWRVTCDGVVREEWAAPRPDIRAADVTEALAGAAGEPDRDHVEIALRGMIGQYGSELVAPPRVLWAGPVPHDNDFESITTDFVEGPGVPAPQLDLYRPEIVLVAAPAARGGWIVHLSIDIDARPDDHVMNIGSGPAFIGVDTDPGDPASVLAVRVSGWNPMVFVLAPEGATQVRLVAPDGAVLDESVVTQRAILLALPRHEASFADVQIEAFDATGAAIGAADISLSGGVTSHHLSEWS